MSDFKQSDSDLKYYDLINNTFSNSERCNSDLLITYQILIGDPINIEGSEVRVWNRFIQEHLRKCNFEQRQKYNEGYKKGLQYFEDNFKVLDPKKDHIINLLQHYNNVWKEFFKYSMTFDFFRDHLENFGCQNGILAAYINYEAQNSFQFESYLKDFKKSLKPEDQKIVSAKPLPAYEDFFTDKSKHIERNKFKNSFRKNYEINPNQIGREIADLEAKEILKDLSRLPINRKNLYKVILGFEPDKSKIENAINRGYRERWTEIDPDKNNKI